MNRGGNKFINSKNAHIGSMQNTSNSIGRDSLKSAGGVAAFEAKMGTGMAAAGAQNTMAGLINQQ